MTSVLALAFFSVMFKVAPASHTLASKVCLPLAAVWPSMLPCGSGTGGCQGTPSIAPQKLEKRHSTVPLRALYETRQPRRLSFCGED